MCAEEFCFDRGGRCPKTICSSSCFVSMLLLYSEARLVSPVSTISLHCVCAIVFHEESIGHIGG